jgi:hypothetical protein
MGYTHNWSHEETIPRETWSRITADAEKLVAAFPHPLSELTIDGSELLSMAHRRRTLKPSFSAAMQSTLFARPRFDHTTAWFAPCYRQQDSTTRSFPFHRMDCSKAWACGRNP